MSFIIVSVKFWGHFPILPTSEGTSSHHVRGGEEETQAPNLRKPSPKVVQIISEYIDFYYEPK